MATSSAAVDFIRYWEEFQEAQEAGEGGVFAPWVMASRMNQLKLEFGNGESSFAFTRLYDEAIRVVKFTILDDTLIDTWFGGKWYEGIEGFNQFLVDFGWWLKTETPTV